MLLFSSSDFGFSLSNFIPAWLLHICVLHKEYKVGESINFPFEYSNVWKHSGCEWIGRGLSVCHD